MAQENVILNLDQRTGKERELVVGERGELEPKEPILLEPEAAAGVVFEKMTRTNNQILDLSQLVADASLFSQLWDDSLKLGNLILSYGQSEAVLPTVVKGVYPGEKHYSAQKSIREALAMDFGIKLLPIGERPGDAEVEFVTRLGELVKLVLPKLSSESL